MNKVTGNGGWLHIEPEEAAEDMAIVADVFIESLSLTEVEYTRARRERILLAWCHVRDLLTPPRPSSGREGVGPVV